MAHKVAIINGKVPSGGSGGVSDADFSHGIVNFFTSGMIASTDYQVTQQASPDMTVKVATGKAYVANPAGTMIYQSYLDTNGSVTVPSNSSGNPRIDAIVLKLDLGATPNKDADNVATLIDVQGTPAASPSAPTDGTIQTAVGASNGFVRLANVTVANGASSITNANISDQRIYTQFKMMSGRIKYNTTSSKMQYSNDGVSYYDLGGGGVSETWANQGSDAATPTAGYLVMYSKTDDRFYRKTSGGVVRPIAEDAWETLTDGATITLDWSTSGKKILKSMGGNRTFAHSNIVSGRFIAVFIRQDGTGSRLATWDKTGSETFATTDVDTANDKITVTEDVPTGTPIQFSSTTTLPAGLSASTTYYAINVDATHIKVASSLANAQAGTQIDITSQGTGTHTIMYYLKWDNGAAATLSTGKYNTDKIVFEAYSSRIVGASVVGRGEI